MTTIENTNGVPTQSNPDGGEEKRASSPRINYGQHVMSISDPSPWTTTNTSAQETWIRQSLDMPTTSITASTPGHRRERSQESFTALFEPAQSEWAAHANSQSMGDSARGSRTIMPGPQVERQSSNASNPYFNLNSWGYESLGNNNEGIFDPTTFSASFSGSTDDDPSGIPSDIHDAARIFNWKVVGELCETMPQGAAYIGEDGWTALHHACNRRCPDADVVEALIRAYPDALLITEDKGWTPLHYACRFKAPRDVVEHLLTLFPEKGRVGVSKPDRRGRMPLYYAVRYDAPPGVVGLLMDVDASAILEEDQNSDSPLALIWDDAAEKLDGIKDIKYILVGDHEGANFDVLTNRIGKIYVELQKSSRDYDRIAKAAEARKRLERKMQVLKRWKKANVFLKAAFGFPTSEGGDDEAVFSKIMGERTWRILHATSAIKCHPSLFLFAACLHPEQAFELDNNDLRKMATVYKAECANAESPSNLTALHLAADSNASGDTGKLVLTQLISMNPNAASCLDSEGSTPLHRISGNIHKPDWCLDAVEDVYLCHKGAIEKTDANGRLPLHRAADAITYFSNRLDAETVTAKSKICNLLAEHLDGASKQDIFGCLPLHLVAKNGEAWDPQVQALYDGNPAAVRVRTGVKMKNRLPLHFAAANASAHISMISKLLEYNPQAASQADRNGMLPLHLACKAGHSWEVVSLIHRAYPAAVEQVASNKTGQYALHMAAAAENSDGQLLSELLQLYPDAASFCDKNGQYPMHLACTSGKVWDDGLSSLFEANANAIRCRDKNDMLPLHIVAFRNCLKPAIESIPTTFNRSSRRSRSLIAIELERKTRKENREAQELTNIYEILISDPTALIV